MTLKPAIRPQLRDSRLDLGKSLAKVDGRDVAVTLQRPQHAQQSLEKIRVHRRGLHDGRHDQYHSRRENVMGVPEAERRDGAVEEQAFDESA